VCLLAQTALPCALFAPGPLTLNLRGGTNADMAPQIDEYTEIFLPNIARFGFKFEYEVVKKGFFPAGGGEVNLYLSPVSRLRPVSLTDPGRVISVTGWSFTAGSLPARLAQQMAAAAREHLQQADSTELAGAEVSIESYKEDAATAPKTGSGIVLIATTSTGCILGGSALGSNKHSPAHTGRQAAEQLLEAVECGGCVDKFIQDQMIIFMALADGESSLVTGPLTLHTETAIHIAERMTGARFRVENCENNSRAWRISCRGIGLTNSFL